MNFFFLMSFGIIIIMLVTVTGTADVSRFNFLELLQQSCLAFIALKFKSLKYVQIILVRARDLHVLNI